MDPPAVRELRDRGLKLGIVSTKYRSRIAATLERNGLDGIFEVIVGGEDVALHKPAPEGLLTAMERLGVEPSRTLYVGDAAADAAAAQNAGTPFVAVLSGVTPEAEFAAFPSERILPHVGALPALLSR
ncbi:MAG: HAD-IA family hydrolase [Bryobacterales bacterium]